MRPRPNVAFPVSVLLAALSGMPAHAEGNGRVTIVYEDAAIDPQNREAIKAIKDAGMFERMAERLTGAVALPHDLQVIVTDKLPEGVDDPVTEPDGRRIYWPAAFSKQTRDVLVEFVPEAVRDKGVPKVIAPENFTAPLPPIRSERPVWDHNHPEARAPGHE